MSDLEFIAQYTPRILRGIATTLQVSAAALLVASVLGLMVGLARASRVRWLSRAAAVYTEVLRAVPTLVIMFLTFYGLPILLGIRVPAFPAAVIALGVAGSAPLAEIVRGGIQAVPAGQWEAAQSLGLRYSQTVRFVILAQAFRISLPPTISLYASLVKDSSLVLVVGVVELTAVGMDIRAAAFGKSTIAVFLTVGVCYFAICSGLSLIGQRLERRLAR